jgi:pyridinium-3,5-bisthiocarboxylic acid mononucleotide nickel chelatase
MRIAYLECFSGISGDMFLGALVDAGVSAALLERTVAALNVGARLEISKVLRSGISATKVDVWISDREKDQPRDGQISFHEPVHANSHAHDHAHSHEHHHEHHDHAHEHPVEEDDRYHHDGHAHGRHLSEIKRIISAAPLEDQVKQRALAIFQALGEAEAKIHNVPIEKIHFHEVGAVDAIVDIVCAAVASYALGVDEWVCTSVNVGGGTVQCAHGRLPVPAPATLELLKGVPIYSSGIHKELATPTGAAIVKTLVSRFGAIPAYKVEKTGYGAGTRDFPSQANVLRVTVGESAESLTVGTADTVSVLEANIDDLNPQVFGYVMDRLLEAGALDVFGTPVLMKKNRPGMLLTVLARNKDAQRLTKIMFAETTTLGIRMREERREVLIRRAETVQTPWGEVRMKIGNLNGSVTNYAPEYEDCRRIASEHGVPLKSVMQEAIRVYLDQKNG